MGLGPPVDLEPAQIRVLRIELEDGTVIPVYEGDDNKLFVGPGILVGRGAVLHGEALDNILVEQVYIEEIGDNREEINGVPPSWSARISPDKNAEGWQEWSIGLEGLKKGERIISIEANDKVTVEEKKRGRPGNIGPKTVSQLTLLVDTDPPFVEPLKIERRPGLHVGLMPKDVLKGFDSEIYDNIDYFQNESFILRANIMHDFSLSDVRLNFLNEDGQEIFPISLARDEGTIYTPSWNISHDLLVSANAKYDTDRHYFNVVITATATAGHSNMENLFFSFCWYPESDYPRIQTLPYDDIFNSIVVKRGEIIPITVFDDDTLGEVYAGLVSVAHWNTIPGTTDEQKLKYINDNRESFTDELGNDIFKNNRLSSSTPRSVISLNVEKNRGEYRLITLVRDQKNDLNARVWSRKVHNVRIIEDGEPIIVIESPEENTSPVLTDNKFSIEGVVVNLDAVDFVRIGWIPTGPGFSVEDQISKLQNALKTKNPFDGIQVRELIRDQLVTGSQDFGGKTFATQEFKFTFDVFKDFKYLNVLENEIKFFMIYTQSKADEPVDVFETIRLMPYKQPPVINVINPDINFAQYGSNEEYWFIIHPESESGLPIKWNPDLPIAQRGVTLYSTAQAEYLELTFHSEYTRDEEEGGGITLNNVWTSPMLSHAAIGQYQYAITAEDELGNSTLLDRFVRVEAPPELRYITTPHNEGTVFSSRDTVRIQAVFDRAIENLNTGNPRIILTGFTDDQPRYATYSSGTGGNTLIFEYKPAIGDSTGSGVLTTTGITGRSAIPATIPENGPNFPQAMSQPLADAGLKIDGVAPRITNIKIERVVGKTNYSSETPAYSWHREGEVITFDVTMSKEVRVLGSPRLRLPITNAQGVNLNREATFVTTTTNDTVLQFTYKVQDGDSYDASNLTITPIASCFSEAHSNVITDKASAQGNYILLASVAGQTIAAPNQTSNVRVDSVKPPTPDVLCTFNGTLTHTPPANSHDFRVLNNNKIETNPGTVVEYTETGVQWNPITFSGTDHFNKNVSDSTTYNISARQIDRAGNISDEFQKITFSLSGTSELLSIICDNSDKAYNEGSRLNFKLIFSGPITYNGTLGTARVTLNGGTATGDGTTTAPVVIDIPTITGQDFSLSFSWTVTSGYHMNPVSINAIDLTGVRRATGAASLFTSDTGYAGKMDTVRQAYNRPGVEVLSIRPVITSGSPISHAVVANNTITLTFNSVVWPERGMIRIRPTATGSNGNDTTTNGNWLIPPVLTNAQFMQIREALPYSKRDNLTSTANSNQDYYVRTTHGLVTESSRYVPDTSTKYVLNFTQGIDNSHIRTLLDEARYLQQEIEVVSSKVSGAGTNTITVELEPLDPGRQWKVEIEPNSFRDRAFNYFAGWDWVETGATTITQSSRWFWSQQTAAPVVRVERVSNSMAHTGATGKFQTNVRYRIDSVTPGAVITRGEWNRGNIPANPTTDQLRGDGSGVARIVDTMRITLSNPPTPEELKNNNTVYRANAENGEQNSAILDATLAEIDTTLNNASTTAYTMGNYINLGGRPLTQATTDAAAFTEALYTARKDYVGARATRTGLSASPLGYEGVFKTLVVYRDVRYKFGQQWNQDINANEDVRHDLVTNDRFLKIEATNTRNGAVTIAGFPLWYNDMDGFGSKFFYRNGGDSTADFIFITWEIVSEFWQVSPLTRVDSQPGALWNYSDSDNSWQPFSANYQVHNYRLYGNWGMQVGNR